MSSLPYHVTEEEKAEIKDVLSAVGAQVLRSRPDLQYGYQPGTFLRHLAASLGVIATSYLGWQFLRSWWYTRTGRETDPRGETPGARRRAGWRPTNLTMALDSIAASAMPSQIATVVIRNALNTGLITRRDSNLMRGNLRNGWVPNYRQQLEDGRRIAREVGNRALIQPNPPTRFQRDAAELHNRMRLRKQAREQIRYVRGMREWNRQHPDDPQFEDWQDFAAMMTNGRGPNDDLNQQYRLRMDRYQRIRERFGKPDFPANLAYWEGPLNRPPPSHPWGHNSMMDSDANIGGRRGRWEMVDSARRRLINVGLAAGLSWRNANQYATEEIGRRAIQDAERRLSEANAQRGRLDRSAWVDPLEDEIAAMARGERYEGKEIDGREQKHAVPVEIFDNPFTSTQEAMNSLNELRIRTPPRRPAHQFSANRGVPDLPGITRPRSAPRPLAGSVHIGGRLFQPRPDSAQRLDFSDRRKYPRDERWSAHVGRSMITAGSKAYSDRMRQALRKTARTARTVALGIHSPFRGRRRGDVGGPLPIDWRPNKGGPYRSNPLRRKQWGGAPTADRLSAVQRHYRLANIYKRRFRTYKRW